MKKKSDVFPWDIFKSDTISFSSKNIKVSQWLSKSKCLSFMTKANSNNGNETEPYIFPWEIFTSDTISFCIKKYSSIGMTFNITISHFCDYSEPK